MPIPWNKKTEAMLSASCGLIVIEQLYLSNISFNFFKFKNSMKMLESFLLNVQLTTFIKT